MKIAVIIPVVNQNLANSLLASIERNSIKPIKILIIDNTSVKVGYKYPSNLPITYFKPYKPMSVNESWRYGFENIGKCDAVAVLNDDLVLNKEFFYRTARALTPKGVGVSCPFTVSNLDELREYPRDKFEIVGMGKREGWAFTVKKSVLDQLPPLPDHVVKTFYGDDWIYFWTAKLRRWEWVKDKNNWVWHKGSVTVKRLGLAKMQKREKNAYHEHRVMTYNKWLKENKRG